MLSTHCTSQLVPPRTLHVRSAGAVLSAPFNFSTQPPIAQARLPGSHWNSNSGWYVAGTVGKRQPWEACNFLCRPKQSSRASWQPLPLCPARSHGNPYLHWFRLAWAWPHTGRGMVCGKGISGAKAGFVLMVHNRLSEWMGDSGAFSNF